MTLAQAAHDIKWAVFLLDISLLRLRHHDKLMTDSLKTEKK